MSIYQLKPAFQNLLRPLVRQLAQWGVTANSVTLFACAFAVFGDASHSFTLCIRSILSITDLAFPTNGIKCD